MKAVWYETPGPADAVLAVGQMADPEPGAGEVRVRIVVSGINPVDCKRRQAGHPSHTWPRIVPHFDGAGVIDRVGVGVPAARTGERVWVCEAQLRRPGGTAAEFTTVPADRASPLPDDIGFDAGACLGVPAITAHTCVLSNGDLAGRWVLVTGGAGAVGRHAVRMAKLVGARVVATVSGAAKAAIAMEAGAEAVVDYRTEDVAAAVRDRTGGAGVDHMVDMDFGYNLAAALDLLNPGGAIATIASARVPHPQLPFHGLIAKDITVRFVSAFAMAESRKRQAMTDIGTWLAAGELTHRIGPRFPLEETAAAHRAVEEGADGKVLVDVAEPGLFSIEGTPR